MFSGSFWGCRSVGKKENPIANIGMYIFCSSSFMSHENTTDRSGFYDRNILFIKYHSYLSSQSPEFKGPTLLLPVDTKLTEPDDVSTREYVVWSVFSSHDPSLLAVQRSVYC